MTKNTDDGFRWGAVTIRTQFQRDDGNFKKRDERTAHFMQVKGVATERNGRETPNS